MTRGSEELHFRIVFCNTPTFAEHHGTKYDTAIQNSAKCFSSHEKMKKCFSSHERIQLIPNLANKTLEETITLNKIVSYRMNPFSFHYHRKIEEKFYTAN